AEAQALAEVDGARSRQLAGNCRTDQGAAEHAVGDTLLEGRGGGKIGVQVHRVAVAGEGGKQLDVSLLDGFFKACLLADFKAFVRVIAELGHSASFGVSGLARDAASV